MDKDCQKLIDDALEELGQKFREDPFRYFNEKDLHFEFMELWRKNCKSGAEKLVREFPVPKRGGHIDFCFTESTKNPFKDKNNVKLCVGIEFYLGKCFDQSTIVINNRTYWLRETQLSEKRLKEHIRKDVSKLENKELNIEKKILAYFLCHSFDERSSENTQKKRCKKIVDFTKISEKKAEGSNIELKICEQIYINGKPTTRGKEGLDELNEKYRMC